MRCPPKIRTQPTLYRTRRPNAGRVVAHNPALLRRRPPLRKRLGGERFRSRKRIFRQTSFRLTMLVGRNFKKRYVVFRIVPHGAKKYFEWAVFRNREGGSQPPYKRRFSPIFSPEKIGCPSGMRTKAARLQEPNHSGVGEGFHPLPPVIHPETVVFRLRMVPLYGRAQRPAPTP